MTYRELLAELQKLSPEQLDMNMTVTTPNSPMVKGQDILPDNHPIILFNG